MGTSAVRSAAQKNGDVPKSSFLQTGSHSAHRLAQFQILGTAVRLLRITSDCGVWIRRRMSCSYIHSSSKFSGTSPNVCKIVASPKFPMLGSPLRLNASAPELAGSRVHRLGPANRGRFVGHLLRLARRYALFGSHKRQGYVVCDGYCCLLREPTFRFAPLAHLFIPAQKDRRLSKFCCSDVCRWFEQHHNLPRAPSWAP